MDNNEPPDWFINIFVFWINVGVVWFAAWILNPNLTSGTVWFFAVIFSSLMTGIDEVRRKVK